MGARSRFDPIGRRQGRTLGSLSSGTQGGTLRGAPSPTPTREAKVWRPPGVAADRPSDIVFDMAGTVALSPANVGRFRFRRAVSGLYVVVTLDGAGTSNTVVTFYRNGVALTPTVTLGSGDHDEDETISSAFDGVDDYLQAKVTTVGTGAPSDLVVEVWGQG